MITNGRRSFALFLYSDGEIQWTTGDASDGVGGFGGTPAQDGFNAGDGECFASVTGSQTAAIVNIDSTSNVTDLEFGYSVLMRKKLKLHRNVEMIPQVQVY